MLAHRSTDFSFPSDHAAAAGALTAGLFLVSARLGAIGVAAAGMLSFSRVYIAAHYPHDVLVGLVPGATITLLGWQVVRRSLTAAAVRMADTRFGPLMRRRRPTAVGG